jgi:hypothetical protein
MRSTPGFEVRYNAESIVSEGNGHKTFEEGVLERFKEYDRRFDSMQQSIAELTNRLLDRFDQVNARLDQTNARLDQLIINTGAQWRELERRVSAIEDRLGPS